MSLIPQWRKSLRLHSVWVSLIGMVFSGISAGLALAYGVADSTQRAMLSPLLTYTIFFVIFTGVIVGRVLQQGRKDDGDE